MRVVYNNIFVFGFTVHFGVIRGYQEGVGFVKSLNAADAAIVLNHL